MVYAIARRWWQHLVNAAEQQQPNRQQRQAVIHTVKRALAGS
jgi:hypothetical protein